MPAWWMVRLQDRRNPHVLACSVSALAILTAFGTAPALAQTETTSRTDDAPTVAADVVIVTARKREETVQDVPASVQAFSQSTLEQLNVSKFEDYARFAPSISFNTSGPGQTKLVIRGVAESTGSSAGESSAGIYLDEQPITSNAQTPDVRIVDVERIEVLNGPQGTLYGASSQSGTLKIITNKPDASKFAARLEATGKSTEDGDPSYDLQGMVNAPIVEDKLAVRVVGFYGEEGGYVDNKLSPTPGETGDNSGIADENINSVTTYGGRAAARYTVNENWTVTASYAFQESDADGLSDYDPSVGDLQTVKFFKEFRDDSWNQAALTIDGDLGFADLVIAASHFRRDIDSLADNTAYMQFLSSEYGAVPGYEFYDFGPDPLGFYDFRLREKRTALEARLASKDNGSRWSWIVGAFYETVEARTTANANIVDYPSTVSYGTVEAYLAEPTDVYFYQKVAYDQDQKAVFGEVSYRFTDTVTGTIGGRYFDANNDQSIYTELPKGLPVEDSVSPAPEDGFTPKFGLSWTPNDDILVYATYSQGFRLGGANRDKPGLAVPKQYDADKLTAYELGLKSTWFDKRLTFNTAAFMMSWDDFQLEVRNPAENTYFFVVANVGQAEIKGVEAEVHARLTDSFTVGAAGTLLSAELSEPSDFLGAPKGARLPVTPEEKFSIYGEYRTPVEMLGGDVYVRADYSYTGDSVNNVDPAAAQTLDSYSLVNLQLGVERDDKWTANLFVNNVSDERGVTFISPQDFRNSVNVIRPREVGVTLSKSF